MTLLNAMTLYLVSCESSCADRTISGYREALVMFFDWLESEKHIIPGKTDVSVITSDLILEYILYLRNRNIKNTSVATYLRPVRTFFNWCFQEEYLHEKLFARVKLPKSDKDVIIPLYQKEVDMIDACFDKNTVYGLRNLLIFHLMLDAGLRSSEVINLKCSDVMLEKNLLYVYGKGSKYRIVLLCPKLKSLICKYMILVHQVDLTEALPPEPLLYQKNSSEPLTGRTIIQLFARLKKQSGVERVHAHLCRHTFATSYIMGGGNLELLRMLLGHYDYSITQNYLHIARECKLFCVNLLDS